MLFTPLFSSPKNIFCALGRLEVPEQGFPSADCLLTKLGTLVVNSLWTLHLPQRTMRSRAHASLSSPRAAQMGASLFIPPLLLTHSIQLRRPGLPHRLTIDSTRRISASRRAKLTPSVASLLLPHQWPTQLSKFLLRQMPSRRCSRASKFAAYNVSSELLTSGPRLLVMGPLYVGPSDC